MESIQQFELILMSKMEVSPPSSCSNTEELPFGDSFAIDLFSKSDDEFTGIDFLAELEKDEKMHLDELQRITDNIDLPLYDFMTGNDNGGDYSEQKQSKTEQLLMEFDSIYDAVELDHLTPPQTPPEQKLFLPHLEESQHFVQNVPQIEQQQQFIFEYQQPQQELAPSQEQYIFVSDSTPEHEISYIYENSNQSMVSGEDFISNEIVIDPEPIISSPADIQRELEVVDEIIQAHSRSQSDYDDDNCTILTTSSWSPRSEYSASSICSQDEVRPVKKTSSSSRGITKKRTRPYGRNPDEKKSRKKEQNKNAATRYRQKKKEEVHVILGEERVLLDRNKKLMTSYKDTKREVKYLKSLLRELFQARGFIQWKLEDIFLTFYAAARILLNFFY